MAFLPIILVLLLGSSAFAATCPAKIAAIVAPYGSGYLYKAELERRGIMPVAVVKSSHQTPKGYAFAPSEWEHVVHFRSPHETAIQLMALGDLAGVWDGSDAGTVMGALLRDALRIQGVSLRGSSGELAWARRDKWEMAELLGDLVPKQFASSNLDEILQWANTRGYPIVIKPNRNAGGTNVRKCWNAADVIDAFTTIDPSWKRLNEMLEQDTLVIAQEVVRGQERAFNGFRDHEGHVLFTGHWEYERDNHPEAASIYVADRLLDPNSKELFRLRLIVQEAVERLDIVGSFHIELIGDKVIDVGARLSGGGLPELESIATDRNPVVASVDGYLAEDPFHHLPKVYSLKENHYPAAVFISTKGHATASHQLRQSFEVLKEEGTLHGYHFHFREGEPLEPTVDSDTVVATVLLRGRTPQEREKLIAMILGWRDRGFFENRQ